jgi:DNA-binding CsgD family transcriptional regulator
VAAQCKQRAGAAEAALGLLAAAQAGPLDALDSARAQLVRAQIIFATTRGRDAPPLLLEAARRLEPLDATLARETYLDAFAAALSADRLVRGGDVEEIAAAVLAAEWEPSTRPCDLLLDGLALLAGEGYAAGAPALKTALRAFREQALSEEEELRWLWLACHVARALGDDVAWDELTARQVELARGTGALSVLPIALDDRIHAELFCGRLASAIALGAEARAVVEATGSHVALRGAIALANWRGEEREAQALVAARRQEAEQHGEGLWLVATEWGNAVRYNGLGRYDEALAAAERGAESPQGLGTPMWLLADLVEAAARAGKPERAAGALERLTEIALANDTDWSLAFLARSRALLAEGEVAERLYREALERLERTRIRVAYGRTLLVYGEWLRRENRRVDAREQLRAAHELLSEIGMEVFAERARRELLATGETVRKRTVETIDDLTPQELEIARRAAEGGTNPEIGAQLFLSPRTVEWHLRKVFGKLGISSRKELGAALPEGAAIPLPA